VFVQVYINSGKCSVACFVLKVPLNINQPASWTKLET